MRTGRRSLPLREDYGRPHRGAAGIPDSALKVSVTRPVTALGALNLAMNPDLPRTGVASVTCGGVVRRAAGGGNRGAEPVMLRTRDRQALQLFGNGAGIFGVISAARR